MKIDCILLFSPVSEKIPRLYKMGDTNIITQVIYLKFNLNLLVLLLN